MQQRGWKQGNEPGWEVGLGEKLWITQSSRLSAPLKEGRGRLGKMCQFQGSDWSRQKARRIVRWRGRGQSQQMRETGYHLEENLKMFHMSNSLGTIAHLSRQFLFAETYPHVGCLPGILWRCSPRIRLNIRESFSSLICLDMVLKRAESVGMKFCLNVGI